MNAAEECRPDTYVMCPEPSPLPDCEDGWEIGNGTAVCSTQTTTDLAQTGGQVDGVLLGMGAGVIVLGVAMMVHASLLQRRHRRQRRQAEAEAARKQAEADALTKAKYLR